MISTVILVGDDLVMTFVTLFSSGLHGRGVNGDVLAIQVVVFCLLIFYPVRVQRLVDSGVARMLNYYTQHLLVMT